jgi:ABC-type dipeptide/oligopeptide/nickel transport system permease subunit
MTGLEFSAGPLRARRGLFQAAFWRRFLRHRAAAAGGLVLGALAITAVLAPVLAPADPVEAALDRALLGPSGAHPLGTDQLGRDILSRIVYGTRLSLAIGLVSVGISLAVGVPLGAAAGLRRGWVDQAVVGLADVLLSFPPLLLAITVVAVLGPGLINAMIAVGIAQAPIYIRLVRAEVLRVQAEPFVEAARALGCPEGRVLLAHIIPNTLGPTIVQSTLNLATAILSASSLGFLGLGAQPPLPEWGAMLGDGRRYLQVAPHVSIFPGLAIMVTVLAFNLFGDGLRDALDPRMTIR